MSARGLLYESSVPIGTESMYTWIVEPSEAIDLGLGVRAQPKFTKDAPDTVPPCVGVSIAPKGSVADALVHVMVFDPGGSQVNHEGQIFLSELSDLTGGSFTLTVPSSVICAQLAQELRVQYLIGYHPTNADKDGKWRKLGVKLNPELGGAKLKARIKRGYYAAKESR